MRKGYMKDVLNAIMSGLVNYIKATLKLSALVYIILAIGLRLIGVDLWSIKALGIAFIDMIPILGSGIVMIPWAIIHFLIGNTTLACSVKICALITALSLSSFVKSLNRLLQERQLGCVRSIPFYQRLSA